MCINLDDTLGFNFTAVGGDELFGFCSSISLTKLMLPCVKTVALHLFSGLWKHCLISFLEQLNGVVV